MALYIKRKESASHLVGAVERDLHREHDVWEGSLAHQLDAIGDGADRGLDPAAAARVRDVLRARHRGVVSAQQRARVVRLRELVVADVVLRKRGEQDGGLPRPRAPG